MRFRCDPETKDRAVRMFEERRNDAHRESWVQSYRHLSGLIGVPPDTVRGWVDRARVDGFQDRHHLGSSPILVVVTA